MGRCNGGGGGGQEQADEALFFFIVVVVDLRPRSLSPSTQSRGSGLLIVAKTKYTRKL